MRIAIMWRHFFEYGGIAVYTRRIVEHLIRLDQRNEYVLLVPEGAHLTDAGQGARVVIVSARTRIGWDQVAVPRIAKRERIDLVFNPKLSVPLAGQFRRAFMLHGMEQFLFGRFFPPVDRLYSRLAMPQFCRRADVILCPSHAVKTDLLAQFDLPADRVEVTPHGVDERFRALSPDAVRTRVREQYRLPEQYLLVVAGLTPLKNLASILRAFAAAAGSVPHQLVLAGFERWPQNDASTLIDRLGLTDRVVRVGWVADDDQPALYQMAGALVMPSLYEGFGLPVVEAMAGGCPVITSTGGALPEVVGDAALIVDPYDIDALSSAMTRVLLEPTVARALAEKGRVRARAFDWTATARRVLEIFERLGPIVSSSAVSCCMAML